MSKTVDELIGVYIEASNAVVWEAEKCGLCPMTLDMQRAGIAAVIRALRDEMTSVRRLRDVQRLFEEILGDAGEKVATAGAIQSQGEAENGLRRSIEGPEGGATSGAFGLERQGNVPVPGERINLHREPPTAAGNIPRRDSDRLPAPHRHEDGRQQVRALVGVTDGPAGRGLGDSSLNEKVAGGPTREDERATDAGFDSLPADVGPSTPAAPAPAVCVWEMEQPCVWVLGCDATIHIGFANEYKKCLSCGKPIKFTEAKT